ncbi:acyltransferase family protein [Escherichia coli]|uniref:acyltransferase family protein n=1 Tax=Escherichia coli TaxID=562 RepID=UPI0004D5887D|nr:acyltransferase [Escherichia coli]EFK3585234.1 acyltransferase [Escherichia coli]KDW03591.1 acyltransferase family protein [Escherichia coli 2-156-04_S1_C3]
MILSLQYLRGIAAILVVLYHYRGELNASYAQKGLGDLLFSNGYIGVDLFFMVSGFVIMLSTEKDKSYLSFAIKRIFRLYPVYIVCLILCTYLLSKPIDLNFYKSLFFIPLNMNSQAPWFGYSLVYTAWTLMYEIVFYFIFSLSMIVSWRYRGLICSVVLVVLPFLMGYYYNNRISLSGYDAVIAHTGVYFVDSAIRLLSSPMFIEFSVGILIYEIYKRSRNRFFQLVSTWMVIISLSLFVLYYITGVNGGHGINSSGIFAALLLLSLTVYEKNNPIKPVKSLNLLGDISYSLYLTHPIIIQSITTLFFVSSIYSPNGGLGNIYIMLMIAFALSCVLFHTIEKPFVNLGRKVINKICR